MHAAPTRLAFAVLSLGITASAHAVISTDSPFIPKNGQAVSGPAQENTPIELRGVMTMPDGLKFAIYEPATQKGQWVKANETGFGYVVRSYDAARSTASVEYQGRVQSLTLKEPKYDGTVAVAPMPAPMGGPQPMRPPVGGPPAAVNSAEEAKRLEQVASEVRRRRAARQAATQTAPAPGTPPPAAPATATPP